MSQSKSWMMLRAAVMLGVIGLTGAAAPAEVFLAPFGDGGTYRIYQTNGSLITWTAAQTAAQGTMDPLTGTVAGRLARIESAAENSFAQTIMRGNYHWIGATDQTVDGAWYWVDNTGADDVEFWSGQSAGSAVGGAYANWNSGEPNNYGSGEAYVELRADNGRWNDQGSTKTNRYIMQWELASLVDATTTGEAIILDPSTGKYIQRTSTAQHWDNSKLLAESRQLNGVQGRLVQVESQDTTRLLGSLGGGWTGLTDNELYGGAEGTTWVWAGPVDSSGALTNNALGSYTGWNSGEPNDSGGEDYMEISNSTSGGWNDNDGGGEDRAALIEFGDAAAVGTNVKVVGIKGSSNPGDSVTNMRNLLNAQSTQVSRTVGDYAAISFADPQGGASTQFSNRVAFPGDTSANDNYFAVKAYATVDITAAGDYTFGVNHDDCYELVVDTGAANVTAVNAAGTTTTLTTVHFDAPGQYNVYVMLGENTGNSSLQLFASAGDYGGMTVADAQTGGASFALVGDTVNGGLAITERRDIGVLNPFHVVRKNGTVGNLSATDALLDNGSIVGDSGDYKVVNFLDTNGNGHFGADSVFPGDTASDDNNFAVEATATLYVSGESAGWWTFAVNSDDGFRLSIDGADFTSFAGDDGTQIVDGNLQFPNGRGTDDSFGSIYLAAGAYDLNLRFWEGTGGAALELFYAAGVHTSFDGSFDLLTVIPLPGAGMMGFAMMLGMASVKRFRRRS
ncbi:hypothetical protein HED60_21030 [Planctomycetales bacterium ZRK34]|nr:hypothetical protein HED60_21030 [Planctomycetales bacterium ZRK34]